MKIMSKRRMINMTIKQFKKLTIAERKKGISKSG